MKVLYFLKLQGKSVDLLNAIFKARTFNIIILKLTAIIRWIKKWNRGKKSFKAVIPVKISFRFHETTEHNRKKLFQRKTPSQLDSHEEMKTKSLFRFAESGGLGERQGKSERDVSKQGRINGEILWFSII